MNRFVKNEKILNLRSARFENIIDLEQEVYFLLDQFVRPYLLTRKPICLKIIVGRGLNSKRLIEGKHPMRYYTENYLKKIGLNWRSGGYHEGQDGVIIVDLF